MRMVERQGKEMGAEPAPALGVIRPRVYPDVTLLAPKG